MRRSWVIVIGFLIGSVLLWLHFATRLSPGVEAKRGAESLTPWISLAGAFVGLLTGIGGLVLKPLEIRLGLSEARARGR